MTIDWNALGEDLKTQLTDVLKRAGVKFVQENQKAAIDLGEDVVRGVLVQEADKIAPILPPLSDTPSLDELAARESICAARDQVFALVAEAERKNAEAVAVLRKNAVNAALGIAGTTAGIAGAAALSAVMKGK